MRLFIGIPISDQITEKIKLVYDKLRSTNSDLSLVSFENLHFTLKFLGDVVNKNGIVHKLEEIAHPSFKIIIGSLSSFDSQDCPKVIWIGEKSGNINSLAVAINEKFNRNFKNQFPCQAHLTLARVKSKKNIEKLKELITSLKKNNFGMMVVDRFVLYESRLTKEGPIYFVVKEFPLTKS